MVFFIFWANALLFDDEFLGYGASWFLLLAVHGWSILLLTLGLAGYATTAPPSEHRSLVIGSVAVAVIGLWTVLPIFYVGLAGIGLATVFRRGVTVAGAFLITGAVFFLGAWMSGVRPGFEDAPDMSPLQTLLTGAGIALAAAGCGDLGLRMRLYAR